MTEPSHPRISHQTLWGIVTAQWLLLLAGALAIAVLLAPLPSPMPVPLDEWVVGCAVGDPVPYIVQGTSMSPLYAEGTRLEVFEGFYRCGRLPKRWDIVIYASDSTGGPVIKQVRAIPGDRIALQSGTLSLNGRPMMNSRWESYRFSGAEGQMLSLYAEGWFLQTGAYLIFGDNVLESIDSRKFGAVGVRGIIGKVDFTEERE